MRKAVISLILGTDFAKHFSILATFKDVMTAESVDMTVDENRTLLLKVFFSFLSFSFLFFSSYLLPIDGS